MSNGIALPRIRQTETLISLRRNRRLFQRIRPQTGHHVATPRTEALL